jgi:predicted transcriptional regulator
MVVIMIAARPIAHREAAISLVSQYLADIAIVLLNAVARLETGKVGPHVNTLMQY